MKLFLTRKCLQLIHRHLPVFESYYDWHPRFGSQTTEVPKRWEKCVAAAVAKPTFSGQSGSIKDYSSHALMVEVRSSKGNTPGYRSADIKIVGVLLSARAEDRVGKDDRI